MKNNDSSPRHRGSARIAELYSGDNWNVACRAAMPERSSDMKLSSQTLLDNCAFRIVFAPDGASQEPIERGNHHD